MKSLLREISGLKIGKVYVGIGDRIEWLDSQGRHFIIGTITVILGNRASCLVENSTLYTVGYTCHVYSDTRGIVRIL